MFSKSKEALLDLQKILCCRKCDQHTEELSCLGDCQHWFCRQCAESSAGYQCPICCIPSVARKKHVDVQLSNVSSLCSQMMRLINGCSATSPSKDILRSVHLPEKEIIIENEISSQEKCVNRRRSRARSRVNTGKCEEKIPTDERITKRQNTISPSVNKAVGGKNKKSTAAHKIDMMDVNLDVSVDDNTSSSKSAERGSFVKLKGSKEKGNEKSVSSVSNIFDIMTEFTTPETRKRRSQSSTRTPTNGGVKVMKEAETITPEPKLKRSTRTPKSNGPKKKEETAVATPQQQKSIQQSNKRSQLSASQNASDTLGKPEAGPTAVTKITPRSVKKRQPLTNLSKRNAKGETLLQVATIKMNIDEVKRLLEAGANPNVKDNAGWTPLHEAVGRGKSDIASLLIASGASVNAPGMDNLTPLHEAVVYQYTSCVQLLIENGADMFSRNVHGYSSFDLAQKDEIKNLLLAASQSRSVTDVDVPLLDESSKPLCFTGSNLSKDQTKLLSQYSKTLQAKVVQEVTPEVTHLITSVNDDGSCSRTFKYLSAIVTGKWIVNNQWLEECHKENNRLSEKEFQVPGSTFHPKSGAPHRALENRLKQLPPLLDGCQVYFYGKFESPSFHKEDLANLVKQGGGVVLKREPHLHNLDDYPYTHPYHAQNSKSLADCTIYVIYADSCRNPPSVQASRMACLPASWLLDSIASFSLLDKRIYVA